MFFLALVFSFLCFIVYFLIPSFSLGLQTLVDVGVGSVCDTWNLEQVSHHHCLQCQCQWGLNVSPGDLKQLGGGRQVGYAAAQRWVPLEAWFEYMVLLSYCCCHIDCHCHCCWLIGDFTGLGLRTAQSTFPFIEHMGFSDMKEWDRHMTLILRSWASEQLLPACLGSMDTPVNMFWDTMDNMLQSSSSSFSNQVHAFIALCPASSKGWASV